MKCTACGAPVESLTGGVGFWDLAGAPAPTVPPAPMPEPEHVPAYGEEYDADCSAGYDDGYETQPAAEPELVPQRRRHKKKKVSVLLVVVLILLVVSLVVNAVLFVLLLKEKNSGDDSHTRSEQLDDEEDEGEDKDNPDKDKDDEQDEQNEQNPSESTNPGVPIIEKPTDETTIPEDNTETDTLEITKQPSHEKLSDKHTVGVDLFKVEVTGKDVEYQWQILNTQTGQWEDVDEEYYQQVTYEGGSELGYIKPYEGLYTQYRCRVRSGSQELMTDEVWLVATQAEKDALIAEDAVDDVTSGTGLDGFLSHGIEE